MAAADSSCSGPLSCGGDTPPLEMLLRPLTKPILQGAFDRTRRMAQASLRNCVRAAGLHWSTRRNVVRQLAPGARRRHRPRQRNGQLKSFSEVFSCMIERLEVQPNARSKLSFPAAGDVAAASNLSYRPFPPQQVGDTILDRKRVVFSDTLL